MTFRTIFTGRKELMELSHIKMGVDVYIHFDGDKEDGITLIPLDNRTVVLTVPKSFKNYNLRGFDFQFVTMVKKWKNSQTLFSKIKDYFKGAFEDRFDFRQRLIEHNLYSTTALRGMEITPQLGNNCSEVCVNA